MIFALEVSRRTGVGGIAKAGADPLGQVDDVRRTRWDRLRSEYEAARAAAARYEDAEYKPARDRIEAAAASLKRCCLSQNVQLRRTRILERSTGFTSVAEEMDRLDDAGDVARKLLMAEFAPDAAALAYKLRLALKNDDIWENEREALATDAERLAT